MTHAQDAEVARLRAQVAELSRPHRKLRSALSAILMVLVLVLTPLAVVASWTSSLLGDTDRYVATMGPLVDDRAVQEAVGARAAQAVTKHLDLDTLLQEAAPEDRPMLSKALGKLGSPIEGAVASFVGKEATNVVASSWFQTFWTDANRRIHAAMVKALTGQGGGAVKVTDDAVTIDLAPVIDQLKQRLVDAGLGVAAKVPEIHTDFTVVQSKDVKKAQTGFRLLQILGTWLAVVVVLIAALAVWLARRRRRALTTVALLIAAGALLLGLGLVIARALYLDKLPAGVSADAAAAVFDQLVRFLRTAVRSVAVLGVAVALGAWLSGPGRRAAQVRHLWSAGIDATRGAAEQMGMRLGPVGPFVHRWKRRLVQAVLAVGALTLALWSYPTGWVVVGIVLAVLFAITVIEFLDTRPVSPAHREAAGRTGPAGPAGPAEAPGAPGA
ncbi:collagen-like triple helix repeat-containing protein [Streptomyces sp. H27-H5]|uniref:collagen-like triple helix repeat-containing protein n=1 Tax=Streptomyces sp. H27-H5 TaxID=2996460 RepID=UPI00226F399D|nr:collagen-like protein [Streptomyces sp. H27-H5]MCY0955357.1 collagen-like protein [Streptomyces sp. H27-H5]